MFLKQNTARINVVSAEERKSEAEQGFGTLREEQQEIAQKTAEIHMDKEKTQNDLKLSEEAEKGWKKRLLCIKRIWKNIGQRSLSR